MNASTKITSPQKWPPEDDVAAGHLDEQAWPIRPSEVFLDVSIVRPGDVLITLGTGPIVKAIQVASKADYSHAAVWLPVSSQHVIMLAESDSDGVGFTPRLPTKFDKIGTPEFVRAYAVPNVRRYKLLRHPDIGTIPHDRLLAAAEKLQEQHFHLPYPHLSRLLNAHDMPASLRALSQKAIDLVNKPDPLSGSFCSELVSHFFDEIGLPLFADGRAPSSIAPKDLDADDCMLKEVGDAFLAGDNFKGWTRTDPLFPSSSQREYVLPYAVSRVRFRHSVSQVVESADNVFALMSKFYIDQMRNLQQGLEEASLDWLLMWRKVGAGATEQAEQADIVASQSVLLVHLIDAIELQNRAYGGTSAQEANLAWACALPELASQYMTIHEELVQAVLQSSQQYQAYIRVHTQGANEVQTFADMVKHASRQVRKLLGDFAENRASAQAPSVVLPTKALDTLAQAHVANTWDIALKAMSADVANCAQMQPPAVHDVPPSPLYSSD